MRKEVVVVAALSATAVAIAVGVAVRCWKRKDERRWRKSQRILRRFATKCATPVPKLWLVADALVADMDSSLSSTSPPTTTTLDMLIAYTNSLPTGEEKGLFYGVNLRGANFLIVRARLGGRKESITELQREEISIPPNVIAGSTQELFNYIALELAKFTSTHAENSNDTKLGFTVSYPVEQAEVSDTNAIKWKSLSADDKVEFVGKDLVNELNQALEKNGVNMRAVQLVNDTVGDLAGGRYYKNESVAAITLGMSTNAAYVEPAQSVSKWQGSSPEEGEMVLDMEWGDFNASCLPLISGMYLGEIVRRVLLKMAQEAALFGDDMPPKLKTPYLLRSPDIAAMHQDTSEDHDVVAEKLKEIFEITSTTPMAREIVSEVCDVVAERGARLAGAGIVGILKKLGRIETRKSVVTVEGGLYEHYRLFRNYVHSSVWEMLGNDLSDNVIIEHSRGGSGAGALFLAASQTYNSDI
ncbi:Hexokinase, C-terminal [Dillenia turbinata]|uniref:Phosphotransferase n=1 Tax=Dillenia turbinata TaxID=194707 RepID=A0AAN8Z801_9MAGN